MNDLLASPLFAAIIIAVFSIHITTATVATYFLTVKRAPIAIVQPTLFAWFVPLFGPLGVMLYTGRIRDWSDEEVVAWLAAREEREGLRQAA